MSTSSHRAIETYAGGDMIALSVQSRRLAMEVVALAVLMGLGVPGLMALIAWYSERPSGHPR
jgi:hypothetical protein